MTPGTRKPAGSVQPPTSRGVPLCTCPGTLLNRTVMGVWFFSSVWVR